jgi:hypothetical protein
VFQRDWVDIASGTYEAVDAWVTANYILGAEGGLKLLVYEALSY